MSKLYGTVELQIEAKITEYLSFLLGHHEITLHCLCLLHSCFVYPEAMLNSLESIGYSTATQDDIVQLSKVTVQFI